MATLTKRKLIGFSAILVALVCFVSLPSLALAESAQPENYQGQYNPFSPVAPTADFSIYAYPSYSSVNAGLSMNTTVVVTARNGFSGVVSLSASVPAGWSASFVPSSVSLASNNGYYWFYYYFSSGTSNSSKLSVTVPSDAATGKYTVVVTGTNGSLTHSTNVTVNVVAPSFQMVAYPSYLSAVAGSVGNSSVLVQSINGFSGTVSLSASCPSGWTATFVTSELSLANSYYAYSSRGGFNYSKLSVAVPSDAAAGKYTIIVTGTSGSLSRSVNVTVTVVAPDFRMVVYPSRTSVVAGTTWNSTVLLASLYGFSGSVALSASVPEGWSSSFVPSSVSLTSNNGYTYYSAVGNWSQLSVVVPPTAAAGKYTIVVTGVSGALSHSVNVTVNVVTPDFQVAAFPSYLWANANSTVYSTVMVSPLYGFTGDVALSATVPDGWSATFAPSSLSVTNGYSGYYYSYSYGNYTTLSVTIPSGVAAGRYTVVVTGTSGSLSHSANVTVTVGSYLEPFH